MALVDLKRENPKEPKEKGDEPVKTSSYYEERPYCLRFTLEAQELDKLGLKPGDFSGMEPMLATVEVEPITIRDIEMKGGDDYDKNRNSSVEFQIRKIEFGAMKKKQGSKFGSFNSENKKGPGE